MTEEETPEPQPHPLTKGVGEVVKDILAEHAPKAAEHGKKAAAAAGPKKRKAPQTDHRQRACRFRPFAL